MAAPTTRVWDPVVRVCHWALAVTVAGAWLTHEGGGAWHEWLGYATLAILGVRVAWGFAGPRRARFADFVHGPAATLAYARRMLAGDEPRHVGHNPLGGWMIVALIAMVAAIDFSGWLYTTDRYWGIEWVEDLHETLAQILLAMIAAHLAGVVLASRRHRENLAAAMIHGRKRLPGAGDVD